ncbi:MAG: zinc-binding dehydrogenase [Streptosporangiales bacterium]|nr:zinc-binding dehydrogenase [Streptosporangiales bacterium]
MRAVVCQHETLRVAEVGDPVPGQGQLLISVERCGICGSDLHARTHCDELADISAEVGSPTVMRPSHEVVLGHEFVGEVLDYGPRTRKSLKPGTRVVAMPVRRDGGMIRMTGFDAAAPGGFAERTVTQEAFTFAVPNGLPAEKAAFTEPLAVAWHAVRRGGVAKGRPAVVVGCGPIGLAVILMLKAAGVAVVIASDFSPGRRDLAKRCGADIVVNPETDSPWDRRWRGPVNSMPDYMSFGMDAMSRLRRVPGLPWPRLLRLAEKTGSGPSGPVIFECVGAPGLLEQVLTGAPLLSRVVVVGVCMQPDRIRPAMAQLKELEIRLVFGYDPGEFHDTLRMIAEGKVDPSPLLTGTVGLDGVDAAFSALGDPEKHAKILIDPSSPAAAP